MPITKLYIEGNLESELFNPILQGNPVLQRGGSKNSLKPRATNERRDNKVAAGYLRDRDFDFDPPDDQLRPTVDGFHEGLPVGWRWCRHEIENYLIDPKIVCEAMGWLPTDIEEGLRQAASKIRHYEAARWTIGRVRRSLPPNYELGTRPEGLNEIDLPRGLDAAAVIAWASSNIENHRRPIVEATNASFVHQSFEAYDTRFDEKFLADSSMVLVWFSGKDMLAAMNDWLVGKSILNPGAFRAMLRDWIITNPMRTLELLPEWNGMIDVVRA